MVFKKRIFRFFPFSIDNFLHYLALCGTNFIPGQQWDQEILKYKLRQNKTPKQNSYHIKPDSEGSCQRKMEKSKNPISQNHKFNLTDIILSSSSSRLIYINLVKDIAEKHISHTFRKLLSHFSKLKHVRITAYQS